MFDVQAFTNGAGQFLLAFAAAGLLTLAFQYIYQLVTPHDERVLIRQGNTAAAITLGGALLGFAIPVATSLTQARGLLEFAAWAVLAGVIQILTFLLARRLAVGDLHGRLERGETAVAVYLAAVSVAVGLLNAASMTD